MGFSRVKVYEDDKTWAWKFILRILAILFNFTGIALTAWALSPSSTARDEEGPGHYYYGNEIALIPWNLITFSLSLIWCLTNNCILLSRSRPIHPGANVGCDLLLWLFFVLTAFFSTVGAMSARHYSRGSRNSYYNYDVGDSAYYPNGTRYTVSSSNPAPECPGFESCAQESMFEARMRRRGNVIAAASTFALLLVLIHLSLFISACRYTHYRRRQRYASTKENVTKEATDIAREIIAQMAQEGRLPPAQHPLQAADGTTRGHSVASLSSPSAPVQQPQDQPVPDIMVHGASQGSVADDRIDSAPRG